MSKTITPIFIEFPECKVEPKTKILGDGKVLPLITYSPSGSNFSRIANLNEFLKFVQWDYLWGPERVSLDNEEILMLHDAQIVIKIEADDWDYVITPKSV